MRKLVRGIDKNGNGRIMLAEFMDYVALKMHLAKQESYEDVLRSEQGDLVCELVREATPAGGSKVPLLGSTPQRQAEV